MESKVTIYGHPVHPMIIVLPLGLLPASVFAELFHHSLDDPTWGTVSFWLMFAGVRGSPSNGREQWHARARNLEVIDSPRIRGASLGVNIP